MESVGIDDSVLIQLEKSLKEIELQNESDITEERDSGSYDSYDDSDDEDATGEYELSAMMDSLVAELQVEIQEQIVQDYKKEKPNSIELSDDFERVHVPDVGETEYSQISDYTDYVPVADYTKNIMRSARPSESSDAMSRTELIHGLKKHLSEKQAKCAKGQLARDRVVQLVPDLETVDPNISFEPIHISSTDPDIVPFKDYSPTRRRRGKREKLEGEAIDPSKISLSDLSESSPAKQSRIGKGKQRTKKHTKKKRLEKLIFDSAVEEQYSTRDEAIRILANSSVWKTICQVTFQPKQR